MSLLWAGTAYCQVLDHPSVVHVSGGADNLSNLLCSTAYQKVCVAGLSINSQRLAEALFLGLPPPRPSLLTEFRVHGLGFRV